MGTPPNPLTPPSVLAAAAKLGWIMVVKSTAGELGTFASGTSRRHLVLSAGSALGAVEWALVDDLPDGVAPVLLSRETSDVLRSGVLDQDGSISFQGRHYRLQYWFDGQTITAQARAL